MVVDKKMPAEEMFILSHKSVLLGLRNDIENLLKETRGEICIFSEGEDAESERNLPDGYRKLRLKELRVRAGKLEQQLSSLQVAIEILSGASCPVKNGEVNDGKPKSRN